MSDKPRMTAIGDVHEGPELIPNPQSADTRWCDANVPWRDRPWPRPVTFDDCVDLTFTEVDVPPDQLGRTTNDETDRS